MTQIGYQKLIGIIQKKRLLMLFSLESLKILYLKKKILIFYRIKNELTTFKEYKLRKNVDLSIQSIFFKSRVPSPN